ncbi:hypothetical protein B4166_2700 [Caldibacillus thermoamylovorans]|uniref:Uncharacterized protein n=1 Tax=Caldibacillus thermoamylovorans TaxID=35841 RepID=A0ABD4A4E7_9BACI|nr:hypothetical protein B4166_2700 [Caldibacillus thermoamylovorans]KIO71960.1 hypothetical protein B4167_3141 [Caldibacillus thermoamylovorans]
MRGGLAGIIKNLYDLEQQKAVAFFPIAVIMKFGSLEKD